MASSYKRGNQYEGEARKILEAEGWKVEGQHRHVSFRPGYGGKPQMIMVGRDIYGCDLIAKKENNPTLWIQVSTVEQKSKKFQQIAKDFIHSSGNGEIVQFWGRVVGKKEFRVFDYPSGLEHAQRRYCVKGKSNANPDKETNA
jgi:hypothetical protein